MKRKRANWKRSFKNVAIIFCFLQQCCLILFVDVLYIIFVQYESTDIKRVEFHTCRGRTRLI